MAKRKPLLSVCMIVRDEERVLARCLKSLAGCHDELCIVDTGSVDGTIAVARAFGARVERMDACNGPDGKIRDFALARNASLALARGAYILWVDADEVLADGCAQRVRKHAAGRHAGVRVQMRWGPVRWLSTRLVRNDARHRFVGRVHEYLELHGSVLDDPEIVVRNRPDKRGKEASCERTIRISEEILAANPRDARTLFYLGNALRSAGRYEDAIQRYRAYLEVDDHPRVEHQAAARALATCHLVRGEWQAAIEAAFRALSIDPRYAETHCVLGDVYGAIGELTMARQWYQSALSVKAPPPDAALFVDPQAYGRYPRMRLRECDQLLASHSRRAAANTRTRNARAAS
jgi:tetratricopeptide (TPR) repeat protein